MAAVRIYKGARVYIDIRSRTIGDVGRTHFSKIGKQIELHHGENTSVSGQRRVPSRRRNSFAP